MYSSGPYTSTKEEDLYTVCLYFWYSWDIHIEKREKIHTEQKAINISPIFQSPFFFLHWIGRPGRLFTIQNDVYNKED